MAIAKDRVSAEAPLPIDLDWDLVKERLRETGRRLVTLMRSMNDPGRNAVGYWTVGDLSAHLTQVFTNFSLIARGGQSPMADHLKLAEKHDDYLRDHPERDPKVLADDVEKCLNEILETAETMRPSDPVTWHGGIEVPIVVLLALIVDEAIVHGWDLARAEEREWKIAPVDAVISLKGLVAVAPNFLTEEGKKTRASFTIKLRTDGMLTFRFLQGSAKVSSYDEGPVDCRISADPVSMLLVGAGRVGKWGPALKGKIVAFGKKPWLGLKFTTFFRNP